MPKSTIPYSIQESTHKRKRNRLGCPQIPIAHYCHVFPLSAHITSIPHVTLRRNDELPDASPAYKHASTLPLVMLEHQIRAPKMKNTRKRQDNQRPRQSHPYPESNTSEQLRVQCSLWIHDETFSTDDIIFNEALWTNGSKNFAGSVATIVPRSEPSTGSESDHIKHQIRAQGHVSSARKRNAFARTNDILLENVRFDSNGPKSQGGSAMEYFVFTPGDMSAELKSKSPNLQISVCRKIANLFDYEDRMTVTVVKESVTTKAASHVEFSFRDVYITRADMRRMITNAIRGQALYKGQEILHLGIRLTVKTIFSNRHEVKSAVFTDATKPVFRSESARVVLYIQMSREMWEFETTHSGIIIFDKFINTFLPELFKKWVEEKARHLVSIVLFTRMDYNTEPLERQPKDGSLPAGSSTSTVRDFYRVVVSHMPSGDGTAILSQLKKEYRVFLRDISIRPTYFHYDPPTGNFCKKEYSQDIISGKASLARHGNLLEAINLAILQHSQDYVDRDLIRTGLSVMIISPGTGYFEVDENILRLTTENLVGNGIGIDLVCLSPRPLHTVPVFQYKPVMPRFPDAKSMQCESPTNLLADRTLSFNQGSTPTAASHNATLDSPEDQFLYAVPHWMETHHYRDPQDPLFKQDKWVPTSRLYEFMMSGIMEIEQSDVSIPFLHETHPQFTGIGTGQPAVNATVDAEGRDVAAGDNEATRGNNISEQGDSLAWMDEYDAQLFEDIPTPIKRVDVPPKNATPSPDSKRRNMMDFSKIESTNRLLGTSPTKTSSNLNSSVHDRVREPSVDRRQQMNSNPIKDQTDLAGKESLRGSKRVVSRSLLIGGRGLNILKAGATTAGNYEPFNAAGPSEGNARSIALEQNEKELPTTLTSDVNYVTATRESSFTSEHPSGPSVQTAIRGTVRNIMESSLGARRHGSTHIRNAVGSGASSQTSPWHTLVNPCVPIDSDFDAASYRRCWQHLCPNTPRVAFIKWNVLCTPAALPLTTSFFPSQSELEKNYEESSHKIAVDDTEVEDIHEARQKLMRELLDFRLSKGFQVVQDTEFKVPVAGRFVASKEVHIFDDAALGDDNITIFLSRGDTVHILCAIGTEVQVVRYQRRLSLPLNHTNPGPLTYPIPYKPFFKTAFANSYEQQDLSISSLHDEQNWSAIDQYLAGWGREEYSENLQYWRARFVLIPIEPTKTSHRPNAVLAGDSDDEIHVEGIQKITQIWDKNRYIAPGDRAPHAAGSIPDPNPLGLEFQTRDASTVVSAGLEDSLLGREHFHPSTRIFSHPYVFKAADIDLPKLAHAIQGEEGIKMKDRRWFLTLHHNCFVGTDLTSWLLINVKDVTTREQAVELGQRLMDKGLFQHVSKKHPFRDGIYFYAISSDYREMRADSRTLWPFRKIDKSVPSTPATEVTKDFHTPEKPRQRTAREAYTPDSETNTPERATSDAKQTKVKLSAVMEYNVGARKGSNRAEVVKLHYDRLYNPESCHHFRLEWLDANPKLIEDAITLWTTTAEKYGLKLVQVPIAEMRTISDLNPFRSPYTVQLSIAPPSSRPEQFYDSSTLGPQYSKQRYSHQRTLLRHFNFILDQEAATNFPADVAVSHSWGKLEYKWTQYIHKTGSVMAQVDDDGNLLLVANRLLNCRFSSLLASGGGGVGVVVGGMGPGAWNSGIGGWSPGVGGGGGIGGPGVSNKAPAISAEAIVSDMVAFCQDEKKLAAFWEESAGLRQSARSTPMMAPSTAGLPALEI